MIDTENGYHESELENYHTRFCEKLRQLDTPYQNAHNSN